MVDWVTFGWNVTISILTGVAANWLYDHVLPSRTWPRTRLPLPSLWGVLVIVYAVGWLYVVERRWLLPLNQRILVVALGLVVIVVVTLVVQLLRRRLWEQLLIVVVAPLLVTAAADPWFPHGIRLECSRLVGDEAVFKGQVANANWKINVLVHPLRTPDWWVQQVPLADRHGAWEVRMAFGGESGERFQVLAIAIPEGALYKEGDVVLAEQIPVQALKSSFCEVMKQ